MDKSTVVINAIQDVRVDDYMIYFTIGEIRPTPNGPKFVAAQPVAIQRKELEGFLDFLKQANGSCKPEYSGEDLTEKSVHENSKSEEPESAAKKTFLGSSENASSEPHRT